jgi:cytochrome b561
MPRVGRVRYNGVAMILHWVIAALIVANILLAWYFNTLHGAAKAGPVQLHKSFGITVLILSVLRLVWRFVAPPPALPTSVTGWERVVAGTVYVLFYVVMIGMPLTGWALSSASPLIAVYPIKLYGVIPWPAIGYLSHLPHDQMKSAHATFVNLHYLGAWLVCGLIVLHVAAAMRHWLILRDGVSGRMIPFLRAPAR